MKTIGATYGTSTTQEARAIILDDKTGLFDFVMVEDTLCQISKLIIESDVTIDMAKKIAIGEEKEPLLDVIAELEIIGCINGASKTPTHPVKGGKELTKADSTKISKYLGFKKKKDNLVVGKLLRRKDVHVILDRKMFHNHISILGMIGKGKSHLSKVILKQICKWPEARPIVVDPHGEYTDGIVLDIPNMKGAVEAVEYNDFHTRLEKILPKSKENTMLGVLKAVSYKKMQEGWSHLHPIDMVIKACDNRIATKGDSVLKYVKEALRTETVIIKVKDAILTHATNEQLVIMLKGLGKTQGQAIAKIVAETVLELGKAGHPSYLFIDEVHRFCPQDGSTDENSQRYVPSKGAIIDLALEGRKFGCGLIIMSQRPAKVDKDVISQCNTKFCLKITNRNDINQVRQSTENETLSMFKEVQRLRIGEALLTSSSIERPIFIKVDPYES